MHYHSLIGPVDSKIMHCGMCCDALCCPILMCVAIGPVFILSVSRFTKKRVCITCYSTKSQVLV